MNDHENTIGLQSTSMIFEWDDSDGERDELTSFAAAVQRPTSSGYAYYVNVTRRNASLSDLVRMVTGIQALISGDWPIAAKVAGIVLL